MRFRIYLSLILCVVSPRSFSQEHASTPNAFLSLLPEAPKSQLVPPDLRLSALPVATAVNPSMTAQELRSLDGTQITLTLVDAVSSQSATGSGFRARLGQSLLVDGKVALPEGTLFEGHVATTHARRMMRPGSMFLTFDRMILPNGEVETADLHLTAAESVSLRADAEGKLHPTVSKKRLAIQLGGTALAAKFADDLAEAIGGSAVGAGSARFVGAGAAATFFMLQKGREVNLKAGDEISAQFGQSGVRLPLGGSQLR